MVIDFVRIDHSATIQSDQSTRQKQNREENYKAQRSLFALWLCEPRQNQAPKTGEYDSPSDKHVADSLGFEWLIERELNGCFFVYDQSHNDVNQWAKQQQINEGMVPTELPLQSRRCWNIGLHAEIRQIRCLVKYQEVSFLENGILKPAIVGSKR